MSKAVAKKVVCNDSRYCFAKRNDMKGHWFCEILKDNYPDGVCPFCKPERDVTNGEWYPWDPTYKEPVIEKKVV